MISQRNIAKIKSLLHVNLFKPTHPQAYRNRYQWILETQRFIKINNPTKLNELTFKLCDSVFHNCHYVGGENESIFFLEFCGEEGFTIFQLFTEQLPDPRIPCESDLELFLIFLEKLS